MSGDPERDAERLQGRHEDARGLPGVRPSSRGRLYLTRPFTEGVASHGGHHRYQQIKELVVEAGFAIAGEITTRSKGDLNGPEAALTTVKGLSYFPFSEFGCIPSLRGIFRIGAADAALRELRSSDTFLWAPSHAHGANLILGQLARRKGARVLALIHNIESLVPNQRCPIRASLGNWLDVELAFLAKAEVIYCHSRWDQWFLRLHGLEARLLPYYPPKTRLSSLSRIRAARLAGDIGRNIVVLGNARNEPTRLGMTKQLRIIRENAHDVGGMEFHFFGEDTTQLSDDDMPPNIHVHGYAHADTLALHLTAAKAVWFHQPATTGVLTRVVDMLVAGVPVIANRFAARSQEEMNGMYIYDLDEDAPTLLRKAFAIPEVPSQPHPFARDFIRTLGSFAADGARP